MSQDNYVVVKQELIQEEERISYSSLGYFRTKYESECFCRGKICEKGDVLYVCDTARIVELPTSAIFAYVAPKDGLPKEIIGLSVRNLINWFDRESSAAVLLSVAFYAGVPDWMIRYAACECIKSMAKQTEEADELVGFLEYIQTLQELPLTGEIGKELHRIKGRVESIYIGGDPHSSCVAKSILYVIDTSNATAVDYLDRMNFDTSHMPSIVKGLIPDSVFLMSLVSD